MASVLIVDDERSIRMTLAEFIREEGHEVFVASDAKEALELLAGEKPSVVVTDIILPRVSGISLLKNIKEAAPDVQVVMITGEPSADTAAEAVRLGAFDYLSKPIASNAFKSCVTSALRVAELALERRRLAEENRRYQEHLEQEIARKTGSLRDSEEKYRAVVENATEAIFVLQNGVIPFVNPSALRLFRRSLEELREIPFERWIHSDDRSAVAAYQEQALAEESPLTSCQFRLLRPDGSIRWLDLQAVLISWGGTTATLNFASDITDHKRTETKDQERRERIERQDTTLVELAMSSILYQGSLQDALNAISEAAARTLQVNRVTIWRFDDSGMALHREQLFRLDEAPSDDKILLERNALSTFFHALSEERVLVADDARTHPKTSELANAYLVPLGITALLEAPIRLEGKLVGAVGFEQTGNTRHWELEDVEFASSIADLVSLALEGANRKRAEKSLQQALDGTIGAISMATETRDPYTAGHQRRVTELAVAIATKMGLDQNSIDGTRVAGLMHDIGKLAIPAEILSKPSALSDVERALMESHPRAAYDILQTISFPWPIAEIVLQHHERVDGSGYPQGLPRDEILVEARILAVADTVEAMASHRPYRPSLGIERALEEIERGKGLVYDPDVVDACLCLFRDGEFSFRDLVP